MISIGKRILLIDDDSDDAEIFGEALQEAGIEAVFEYASDGYAACEKLVESNINRPDVIFLDINMPTFDGWDCLKTLKGHLELQKIPVIMYSTAAQEWDKKKAAGLGAYDFLTKPNSYKDLKKRLVEIIAVL